MELEGAIESLKNLKILFEIEDERDFEATPKQQRIIAQQIETVLNHLTKQEKMIELMAIKIKKQISCYDPCWLEYEDDNIKCYGQEKCKECIKQYFERKQDRIEYEEKEGK